MYLCVMLSELEQACKIYSTQYFSGLNDFDSYFKLAAHICHRPS